MRRWLLIAAGVACVPTEDPGDDDAADTGAMTSTSGATSTGEAEASTDSGESGPSETTNAADSSSGEPGDCEPDALPAEFSEVDGCGEVLGESFCSEGAGHVPIGTDIEWANNPPHSGEHFPMWELWGEHESTVERGYWVHNMEHGGIVLGYRCADDCEAEVEVLREVIAARPDSRILLTPDAQLEGDRFAAVSWTWVYRFDEPDLDTLLCFVDQHFNHAPEDVP